MPVPYGFGVGDFVAVGTLAWSVYKSCKAAPESFENISMEVLSLHAVLKESEETLFRRPLKTTRAERLIVIKDGCDKVLTDLQSLVDKYESLGTKSKRTWDRMKWGNEDIAEIRARLISSTTMLNAFISTSESSVESKLDEFVKEYRQGRREASVISFQSVDSLSAGDKALWRMIRKELEEIGISVAAFDANRKFIFDWLIRAAENGAFEEQGERGSEYESDYSDEQASRSNNEHVNQDAGQETRHTQSASSIKIREKRPSTRPQLLVAATVAGRHSPPGPRISGEIDASTRVLPNTQVSRIAAFWATVSLPVPRLFLAVMRQHFSKALKILSDEASSRHFDRKTLGEILLMTTLMYEGLDVADHLSLISKLIARGANVDYRSSGFFAQTPLQNSVRKKSIAAVRLLIENGADVNYHGLKREPLEYDSFTPRLALTEDTEMLRLLLSAGADASAVYKVYFTNHFHEAFFDRVTLLHEAAHLGQISAMETLIEHGADVDLFCPVFGTALMVALLEGKANAARLLLARGANPEFEAAKIDVKFDHFEISYKTPIEAAIVGGDEYMVSLLLKSGVPPKLSMLHYAKEVKSCLRNPVWGLSASFVVWSTIPSKREHGEIIHVLEKALENEKDRLEKH